MVLNHALRVRILVSVSLVNLSNIVSNFNGASRIRSSVNWCSGNIPVCRTGTKGSIPLLTANRYGVMAIIRGFHPRDQGSTPCIGIYETIKEALRAHHLSPGIDTQ